MKDNRGILALLVVVGIVILAVILLRQPKTIEIPVDIGTDFPAEVVGNFCKSREGVEIGLCCAIWNYQARDFEWVLCEDLVLEPYPQQAFFTSETGSTLQNIAGILYVIRITNDGNIDSSVKISSITVVKKLLGNDASVTEIQTKMNTFLNLPAVFAAKKGGYAEYPMATSNVIRIDCPAFMMADGTYSIKIDVQATNEAGAWVSAGSRTVDMKVEQEVVSFAIAVTSTAQ